MSSPSRICGLLVCAADGAADVRTGFVEPAIAAGWSVAVTVTPTAASWFGRELDVLAERTGHPVRVWPRTPEQPRRHPQADVYALVPASANTIAKLALGIADNQVLTTALEALGEPSVPVVAFPGVTAGHARHPSWAQHLARLREAGVHLVYGPEAHPLPEPREDHELPWQAIIAAVEQACPPRG